MSIYQVSTAAALVGHINGTGGYTTHATDLSGAAAYKVTSLY